jgi:hypothetical protein
MRISIARVDNGWLLRTRCDDRTDVQVFEVPESAFGETNEAAWAATFVRMLWSVNEAIGPPTSRYSAARVHIDVRPGDKHEPTED